LLFPGRPLDARRAWIVLASSVAVLGVACFLLAEAVVASARALDVPTYFTAVVLAAAATSVPDAVLSVKDARNGLYDDAISNALGSNIFDIAVSLGLPLFVYSLIYGEVSLTAATGASAADVQDLRILLLGVTLVAIALFLAGRKAGVGKASVLLALYVGWMVWIADSAFAFGWFSSAPAVASEVRPGEPAR
jgi:cation:H+ antiporter